jgi:hypothetical protein
MVRSGALPRWRKDSSGFSGDGWTLGRAGENCNLKAAGFELLLVITEAHRRGCSGVQFGMQRTDYGWAVFVGLSISLTMYVVLAGPNFMKAHHGSRPVCAMWRDQIQSSKQLWAVEHQAPAGATPTVKHLTVYLKDNAFPRCPQGGQYTIGALGQPVVCSKHGE